jgi:hypothetical protein
MTLAVCCISFAAFGHAQESQPSAPTVLESRRDEVQSMYDVTTAPFEFRSTIPSWPLVRSGDPTELSVKIRDLPQFADRDLILVYQLIRVDDGAVVGREQTELRIDSSGESRAIALATDAPDGEGVYEIRCSLAEKPDRLWSRFANATGDLASIKTPCLVYGEPIAFSENDDDNSAVSTDSGVPASRPQWEQAINVDPIVASNWQTPSWMPDRATRLVPNVKRVGESLRPWRDETPLRPTKIGPGESVVGALRELSVHQTHRLTIAMNASNTGTHPVTVRVEFSRSPEFRSVSQSLTFDVNRHFDPSAAEENPVERYDILHHASSEYEFVRLTNDSIESFVAIESIAFSRSASEAAPSRSNPGARTISLNVDSIDWINRLVGDYNDTQSSEGYAETTLSFYRLWKATSRLPVHARWLGYDEIVLPAHDEVSNPLLRAEAESKFEGTPESRWANTLFDASLARWGATFHQPLVTPAAREHSPSDAALVSLSDHNAATSGVHPASASPQIVDALVHHETRRLQINASTLPMALDRYALETIAEYRLTPERTVSHPSALGVSSDYVHVFVSDPTSIGSSVGTDPVQVTIANAAPWTSEVTLIHSGATTSRIDVVRASTSKAAMLDGNPAGTSRVSVPPSTIVNLQIHGLDRPPRLETWRAGMTGGEKTLETLKMQVGEVVAKIGTLALPDDYHQLRNGGFEIAGQVGIVGWMHTQFPSTAVALDSDEAIEGTCSIRMTADAKSADRTWLVSESIPVPATGRMAVSMATRANAKLANPDRVASTVQPKTALEALHSPPPPSTGNGHSLSTRAEETPVHRVRVSLEGNRLGKPVRFVSEFNVPCDGQWQPRRVVLETDQVGAGEVDSLRLTIDSLSPGRLWIDDIHLHDQFPTQPERTALQGDAFLAIQGLQSGNLKPAAQLLNNDWSRYLLAHSDRKRPPSDSERSGDVILAQGARSESGVPVTKEDSGQEPKGSGPAKNDQRESVADRFREWLPRPIRF